MKLCIYLFIYFIYKNLAAEIVTQNVKVLSRKFNLMAYMYMGSFDEKKLYLFWCLTNKKICFIDFDCHTSLNLQIKRGGGSQRI